MKKILVYGMTDNPGGMESYIMNVFRNMDKSQIMFDFIIDFESMAYQAEVINNGSQIYKIPPKSRHPMKHLLQFCKILSNHPEYDTVYFNILNSGIAFSMIAPKIKGRKVVVHSHNGSDNNLFIHKLLRPLLNILANKKYACSVSAAEFMFNSTKNVTVINNAINTEVFSFDKDKRNVIRTKLNIENRNVVITVGRMSKQKNPFFLLDIFREIIKLDSNYVLLYVGEGDLKNEIKAYADKFNLADNILFLGVRSDISDLLAASDCFLLPSLFEGFPISLVEAQSSGLRCYTSKHVVTDKTNINGLVTFIELDKPPEIWAETICIDLKKQINREIYKHSLDNTGYDIKQVVGEITDSLKE